MTEYTPSDDELYEQIAKRRYEYDYTSPWEHLAPAPRRLLMQAARNTMEPIIAQVKRDAAREALDGLTEAMQDTPGIGPSTKSHRARMRTDIRIYRVRNYPETEVEFL